MANIIKRLDDLARVVRPRAPQPDVTEAELAVWLAGEAGDLRRSGIMDAQGEIVDMPDDPRQRSLAILAGLFVRGEA